MIEEPIIHTMYDAEEDQYIVEFIQPTENLDAETIEILLADQIATGG